MTRCPLCAAGNPATARWCNQCLSPLAHAPAAAVAPAAPVQDSGAAPEGVPGGRAPPGFRRHGERVEWECPTCATLTSVHDPLCRACRTPLTARFLPRDPSPPRAWGGALALSVLLPGAGHVAVDQHGSGLARILLYSLWLAGGVVLAGISDPRSVLVAAPLLLGAAIVLLTSVADVLALRAGTRQVLEGRVLLWLVIGVTGLTLLGAVGAVADVMA